jgi:hypothetical protein
MYLDTISSTTQFRIGGVISAEYYRGTVLWSVITASEKSNLDLGDRLI